MKYLIAVALIIAAATPAAADVLNSYTGRSTDPLGVVVATVATYPTRAECLQAMRDAMKAPDYNPKTTDYGCRKNIRLKHN